MPTPLWLDCDTGHDDAFAILLAAVHPGIDLLGVSTVYGNAPLEKTTYNTRAILKAIGKENVPVYAGAAKPFCREVVHATDIHGESGLDGTTVLPVPEVPARTDETAINAMYHALMSTPKGTAWLVPTGALTNAALLFATHPDLASHIGGLSIMGGAVGGKFTGALRELASGGRERVGNITPWAEFNVYVDPESARSLLSNPILTAKTTLITLDLTHQFLATKPIQEALLYGSKSPQDRPSPTSKVRTLFVEILAFFAKTYAGVFGITSGPPVHDPLAVAAAFMPDLFVDGQTSRGPVSYSVDVITHDARSPSSRDNGSSQDGRTVVLPLPQESGLRGVRIPIGLDAKQIWELLDQCLELAEGEVA